MAKTVVTSSDALAALLIQARKNKTDSSRLLVGIAGAPGSGKSTLAAELVTRVNTQLAASAESSIVVPMDGFHLDNVILDQHGTRAVKGSPQTFDIAGLLSLVQRLAAPTQQTIYAPLFDRRADLARNAAQAIETQHSIVIVEGNYLLLQRDGWRELRALFDCTVMLDVPESALETRLIQRWLDHDLTPAQARLRASSNDIPNAHVVVAESTDAHVTYSAVR